MHTLRPTLVTAALVLALTFLPTVGAAAEKIHPIDPVGDTSSRSDIKWVEVTHSKLHNRLQVRVGLTKVVYGAELVVFLDRNLGNPGPELRVVANPDSEWATYKVTQWGERGKLVKSCGGVSYSKYNTRPIASWRATRSCLNLKRLVRVSVRVDDVGHGVDWVKAKQTFLKPVSAL